MTTSGPPGPKKTQTLTGAAALKALLDAQAAAPRALPPHDPNAPPAPASPPPPAGSKPPKGFTDGIMGAALGHAADNLLGSIGSTKAQGMGVGSMLLGGLSKLLAAATKDTNPELAATLNAMGTGAIVGAAAKAAANFKPEPLIEEAQKAVAEAAKQPPHVIVQVDGLTVDPSRGPCQCTCGACAQGLHIACNFQCDDARRKGDAFVEPLVEEAQLAITDIQTGTEPQFIDPEPLIEEADRWFLDPQNSTGAASDSNTSPAVEPLIEEAPHLPAPPHGDCDDMAIPVALVRPEPLVEEAKLAVADLKSQEPQ